MRARGSIQDTQRVTALLVTAATLVGVVLLVMVERGSEACCLQPRAEAAVAPSVEPLPHRRDTSEPVRHAQAEARDDPVRTVAWANDPAVLGDLEVRAVGPGGDPVRMAASLDGLMLSGSLELPPLLEWESVERLRARIPAGSYHLLLEFAGRYGDEHLVVEVVAGRRTVRKVQLQQPGRLVVRFATADGRRDRVAAWLLLSGSTIPDGMRMRFEQFASERDPARPAVFNESCVAVPALRPGWYTASVSFWVEGETMLQVPSDLSFHLAAGRTTRLVFGCVEVPTPPAELALFERLLTRRKQMRQECRRIFGGEVESPSR